MIFFNIVFPVFVVMAIGFLVGRVTNIDFKPTSKLTLYIFTPALFFNSVFTAQIDKNEFARILGYAFLLFFVFIALVYVIGVFVLKYPPQMKSALLLSTAFPNSGNYGLPIILFAFAQAGFDRAVIFTVFQSFLMNSAGVYFASNSKNSFSDSLRDVIKMPGFIALLVAILMKSLNISLPEALLKPVQLAGQASIPSLLVILGMQLARADSAFNWKFISFATVLRLCIYPIIGLLFLPLFFEVGSLTAKVMAVEVAVPSAASTTLLAMEFDARPELVSSVTFVTTILSLFTVSLILKAVM